MHLNEVSEDATEFRFDVDGMPYIKKYWDEFTIERLGVYPESGESLVKWVTERVNWLDTQWK